MFVFESVYKYIVANFKTEITLLFSLLRFTHQALFYFSISMAAISAKKKKKERDVKG